MKYILYNSLAGNGEHRGNVEALKASYDKTGIESVIVEACEIEDYTEYLAGIESGADLILCGGDGTINYFVNAAKDAEYDNSIYYFPLGTGNDFARDIGFETAAEPFCIDQYIKNLPVATVKEEEYLFLNNVGFGLDGYCCEKGDQIRMENAKRGKSKKISYTAIALRGLLLDFKQRAADITVDGEKLHLDKVWFAAAMNGRYYGGGMMSAPNQDRMNEERTVKLMIVHTVSKFRALTILPLLYTGKHVKYKQFVTELTGHDIEVEYDREAPVQIDGETISGVKSYRVRTK